MCLMISDNANMINEESVFLSFGKDNPKISIIMIV